ncbi:acyl-CoA dehydrogenase family protein [Desulfoscipio gibsoniae]|uniref:Acyl-CoA dehydrogenase n=1 Tax=Desulfoscipio gibsoniae DSM 7213 TaxID=767817 RepID=R4KM07_9FIRM|nr:acyl-CoA dehydrogenase family protein [Desulfoscipio gibsoniae]AGL00676.1 acyl-CoA dehydrogenase [Desulfoscipio gibsoniae DSM 7213]
MDPRINEEQLMMMRNVRKIMEEKVAPRAAEIDEKAVFPRDVHQLFSENEIYSLVVPPEYGGLDGQLLTLCICISEISRVCASSSMVLGNQSLGAAPIALRGNEQQKSRYLPKTATGELLPCFALTEPNAGSDVSSMQTRAVPDGDDYIISGNKCFITHAEVGDPFTVFAKVRVNGKDKITAFIVDRDTPGLSFGKNENKMGLRGSPTGTVILENVRVPKENILGNIGDGFRIAFDSLDKGRIMTGAMAIGLAQGALECARDYAKTRVQFGKLIGEQQGIQFMLADMETSIQAARSLMLTAAYKYDNKEADMVRFSAMSKLFATDMVMNVTTNAVQILGGYGYCREYPVERMMRDAKVFAIFEGTNQIQRIVIARDLMKD